MMRLLGKMIRAEWVKFRTVRGWVVAVIVAVAAVAGFAVAGGDQGSCYGNSCTQVTGPGGEAVEDSFYFVHQKLTANGAITARVTSLTSDIRLRSGGQRVIVAWSKAGIILKASLRQGTEYAAIVVTGGNGIRMQDDFTGDIAGPELKAGWLRLVRSGSAVTGYASPDGTRWVRVGTVSLPGLPLTVQGGVFTTSPQYSQTSLGVAQISGSPSQSVATFDHVGLTWPATGWTGTDVGASPGGGAPGPATGYNEAAGQFTVTGSGDIAPAVSGAAGPGLTIAQTLIGTFVALIILTVVGTMFVTSEYRRGLIRLTLTACPRRGVVLAAKALVIGLVTFVAGLAGAAVAVPFGQRALRSHGVYVWPVTSITEVRVIAGTAAVLGVCAMLAVAIGTVLRHGAGAVAAVIVVVVLPYVLAVPIPVLPLGVADWIMRVTPAAAFAVQQTVIQYPQVSNVYAPAYGYFPLAPWAGFCVLCAWALAALAVATLALRGRDALWRQELPYIERPLQHPAGKHGVRHLLQACLADRCRIGIQVHSGENLRRHAADVGRQRVFHDRTVRRERLRPDDRPPERRDGRGVSVSVSRQRLIAGDREIRHLAARRVDELLRTCLLPRLRDERLGHPGRIDRMGLQRRRHLGKRNDFNLHRVNRNTVRFKSGINHQRADVARCVQCNRFPPQILHVLNPGSPGNHDHIRVGRGLRAVRHDTKPGALTRGENDRHVIAESELQMTGKQLLGGQLAAGKHHRRDIESLGAE
jgi:ABC-2 family transporter protein